MHGSEPGYFYAATTVDELQLVADGAALDLLDVAPLGFFRQNAVIAAVLGAEGFQSHKKAVGRLYHRPSARAPSSSGSSAT